VEQWYYVEKVSIRTIRKTLTRNSAQPFYLGVGFVCAPVSSHRISRPRGLTVGSRNDRLPHHSTKLGSKLREPIEFSVRKSVLDGDILSLDPIQSNQLSPECIYKNLAASSSAPIQVTNAENFPCLLPLAMTARASDITGSKIEGSPTFVIAAKYHTDGSEDTSIDSPVAGKKKIDIHLHNPTQHSNPLLH
jgi:hypothetical protein